MNQRVTAARNANNILITKGVNGNMATETSLEQLQKRIAYWTESHETSTTPIPGLSMFRLLAANEPVVSLYKPSVCLIAQGSKRVWWGKETIIYNTQNYLISSVHIPTSVQVVEASQEKPYLGLTLDLNLSEINQLMADSNLPAPRTQTSSRGIATGKVGEALLDAFVRLIELLDTEQDIPILAPLIQREIMYRLLVGDQGIKLRQIATVGSQSNQIANAIAWLQSNFQKTIRIGDLADQAGMSVSTFHHHFRSITALSPLQYQKHLRLQEARRLMLVENLDAGDASFEVGYDSPSQFSREYSRLFGMSPRRDIRELMQTNNL